MEQERSHSRRATFVLGAVLLGFGAVTVRLYDIQVWRPHRYTRMARQQHYARVDLPACRGAIYDTRARMLAVSVQCKSLWADPALVKDKDVAARTISEVLGRSERDVRALLERDRRFVWIARRMSDEQAAALSALSKDPGIGFIDEYRRIYPHGRLANQVLGLTNIDNQGLEGLELMFNARLRGVPGYQVLVRAATSQERTFLVPGLPSQRPVAGDHLVLTIDAVIQAIAEEALDTLCEKFQPHGAAAVAVEPRSGHILAMAIRPTLDPAAVGTYTSTELHERSRLRAITDMHEPGSTFKAVTLAGVLQEGLVDESTRVFCENGAWTVGRRVLHDAHPYGALTVTEVIKKSSNIGATKLGVMLGPERLHRYCQAFGFGEKTGIELPGEVAGMLAPWQRWTSYSITSIPMGQEIACTPLQLVMAYAAIANGGVLMKPVIVRQFVNPDTGKVTERKSVEVRRVLRPDIARRVTQVLCTVTEEGGTGYQARVPGVAVAGKTGTAQKLDENGRYAHDKHVSYFVAFAPADDAKLCVLVMADQPAKGGYYGGTVAAPAVGAILRKSLAYLQSVSDEAAPGRQIAGVIP